MGNENDCTHSNIETDYSRATSCCVNCGLIMESNTSSSFLIHEDPHYYPSNATSSSFPIDNNIGNLWPLKKFSKQLCDYFHISPHIQEQIDQGIFDAHNKNIINLGRRGRVFIGALLFIKCRQYGIPLTLIEISLIMNEDFHIFSQYLLSLNFEYYHQSILQFDPIVFIERFVNLIITNDSHDHDNKNNNTNRHDTTSDTIISNKDVNVNNNKIVNQKSHIPSMLKVVRICMELSNLDCIKNSWIDKGRRIAPISLAIILIVTERTNISQIKEASLKCNLSYKTVYIRLGEIANVLEGEMKQILPWFSVSNSSLSSSLNRYQQISRSIPDLLEYSKLKEGSLESNNKKINLNSHNDRIDNDAKSCHEYHSHSSSLSLPSSPSFFKSKDQRQKRQSQISIAKRRITLLDLDNDNENIDLEIIQIERLLLNHVSEQFILEMKDSELFDSLYSH